MNTIRCAAPSKNKHLFSRTLKPLLSLLCMASLAVPALAHGGAEPDLSSSAHGNDPQTALMKQVAFDQKLNAQVPLDLKFSDESGQTVPLSRYFGPKPVMMVLIYYKCGMLCPEVLNAVNHSLQELKFDAGNQFEIVTVSIDPREKPADALAAKQEQIKAYKRAGAEAGWHFLTGDEASIKALAASIGFRYAWDAESKQYAHPNGFVILTPHGKTARYFSGIDYPAKDLRLSLVEASQGKIGSPLDQVLLMCYHYNPSTGKYSVSITNIVRLAGIATVLAMALGIGLMLRREKRTKIKEVSVEAGA